MMTSLAFIVSLIPLVMAQGASEIARHNVSMPVFAGMIGAATIGIFLIPMLYVVFQTMREWAHSWPQRSGSASGDDTSDEARRRVTYFSRAQPWSRVWRVIQARGIHA